MLNYFKSFSSAEDGAVTVDWVVLTAAVCGLAVAAIVSIQGATGSVGTATGTHISGIQPG